MNVSLIDGHIDGAEQCVMCGRDIPEGSQVCVICGNIKPKDMVEVVRCKDCGKYNPDIIADCVGWCDKLERAMCDIDYCSYGERKETKCK